MRRSRLLVVGVLLCLPSLGGAAAFLPEGNVSGTLYVSSSPYTALGDLRVLLGRTLTIEPGVVLQMPGGSRFNVDGTLTAVGTAASPILFTALAGGTTDPIHGYWGGLFFLGAGSAGGRLEHVTVRYGGSLGAAVGLAFSTATITLSEISDSQGVGLHLRDSPARVTANTFRHNALSGLQVLGVAGLIDGNTFDGNDTGITFSEGAGSPTLTSNVLRNSKRRALSIEAPNVYPQDGGGNLFEPSNAENGLTLDAPVADWTQSGVFGFKGVPYIVHRTLKILSGATLTLPPGAVMKFSLQPPGGLLVFGGGLIADGTPEAPITFTSLRDGAGGSTPARGDWRGLEFSLPNAATRVNHVRLRYTGAEGASAIAIYNSHLNITNSQITQSSEAAIASWTGDGPALISGNVLADTVGPGLLLNTPIGAISNNLFDGNSIGITFLAASSPVVNGNTFRNSRDEAIAFQSGNVYPQNGGGNLFEPSNRINGITVSNAAWTQSGTFGFKEVPHIFRGATFSIETPATVTLSPGTVFKFSAPSASSPQFIIRGNLQAVGVSSQPITFTSVRDASVGGIINRWEDNTAPAPGDWAGLLFLAQAPLSVLDHVHVRYAGSQLSAAVHASGGSFRTMTHSMVSESLKNGVQLEWGEPDFNDNVIRNNVGAGLAVGLFNEWELHDNDIYGNLGGGLINSRVPGVNAANNYWGSPSGPSGAGPGTGDAVSARVGFQPFRATPVHPSTATVSVEGRLVDIFGEPLAQVAVVLTAEAPRTVTTTADGRFSSAGLSNSVGFIRLAASTNVRGLVMSAATARRTDPAITNIDFGDVMLSASTRLSGTLSGTLDQLHSPYLVTANVTVPLGQTLTALPGAILKLGSTTFFTVNGTMASLGVSSNPVIITSLRDGSAGGDSVGDGQIQRQPGQWPMLQLNASGGTTHVLRHTLLRYGGAAFQPMLFLNGAHVTIADCTLSSSSAAGLLSANGGAVEITDSIIEGHSTGLAIQSSGSVHNSWFRGNGTAVYNFDPSRDLDATHNYWDDPSGPTHASSPSGKGQRVSDHVRFLPVLTAPPGGPQPSRDQLPPRTTLHLGVPSAPGPTGFFVSTRTAIAFSAVDDREEIGDGVGAGVAETLYARNADSFRVVTDSVSIPFEGSHLLRWYSRDVLGTTELVRSTSVVADIGPPTVQIVFSPEAAVQEDRIALSTGTQVLLTASDALAGVSSITYRVDASSPDAPFQAYASPFQLPSGQHVLDVRATDRVDNTHRVSSFTLSVSPNPPAGQETPTGFTLPDGTVLIASPFPGIPTDPNPPPGAPTVLKRVSLFPTTPDAGPATVVLEFSGPMDTSADPAVSFSVSGSTEIVPIVKSGYDGIHWGGSTLVPSRLPSGNATLVVRGAKDASGRVLPTTFFLFHVRINRLPPPSGLAAAVWDQGNAVTLAWPSNIGGAVASYRLYRATSSIVTGQTRAPLQSGLRGSAVDNPLADAPTYYYAITALDNGGGESDFSDNIAIAMPLPPSIAAPVEGATVVAGSVTLQGFAQAGVTVEISTHPSFVPLLSSGPATDDRRFTIPLFLTQSGPLLINARTRSALLPQVSSATTRSFQVVNVPLPPTNVVVTAHDTVIDVSWTPAQADVDGYRIYRNGRAKPLLPLLIPGGQTSYRDIGLINKKTYAYVVTAVRGELESPPSASVQTVPIAGPQWSAP